MARGGHGPRDALVQFEAVFKRVDPSIRASPHTGKVLAGVRSSGHCA